jgi:hypothetical protein
LGDTRVAAAIDKESSEDQESSETAAKSRMLLT